MSLNSTNSVANQLRFINACANGTYTQTQTNPFNNATPALQTAPSNDTFVNSNKKPEIGKNGFDYSIDDGKISPKEKAVNFAKGIVAPITTMFSSPKNFLIGAGAIAAGVLLIAATGGAAAPAMVALGVTGGGIQLARSAYKAANAKTDDEAKAAWQGLGSGTTAVVGSVAGSKAALKGAGIDSSKMNVLKATVECFKQAPESVGKSVRIFASGEALTNLKNAFHIKNKNNKKPDEPENKPEAQKEEPKRLEEPKKEPEAPVEKENETKTEAQKGENQTERTETGEGKKTETSEKKPETTGEKKVKSKKQSKKAKGKKQEPKKPAEQQKPTKTNEQQPAEQQKPTQQKPEQETQQPKKTLKETQETQQPKQPEKPVQEAQQPANEAQQPEKPAAKAKPPEAAASASVFSTENMGQFKQTAGAEIKNITKRYTTNPETLAAVKEEGSSPFIAKITKDISKTLARLDEADDVAAAQDAAAMIDSLDNCLDGAGANDKPALSKFITEIIDTIETILEQKCGIKALKGNVGSAFDPETMSVTDTIKTQDPALDDTIAQIFRHGFAIKKGAQVVRPEEVVIYTYGK